MPREFRFPVDLEWAGGRRMVALVDGKEALVIATPPEFKGTDPDLWSPEDAFVAAAGSCLGVTIAALAEHGQLPLRALDVHTEGIVGRRDDGHFGFIRIEQTVELVTDPGFDEAARNLVQKAEQSCLVSVSLALPVKTSVSVTTRELAESV